MIEAEMDALFREILRDFSEYKQPGATEPFVTDVDALAAFLKLRHEASGKKDLVWTLTALALVRVWRQNFWIATTEDLDDRTGRVN